MKILDHTPRRIWWLGWIIAGAWLLISIIAETQGVSDAIGFLRALPHWSIPSAILILYTLANLYPVVQKHSEAPFVAQVEIEARAYDSPDDERNIICWHKFREWASQMADALASVNPKRHEKLAIQLVSKADVMMGGGGARSVLVEEFCKVAYSDADGVWVTKDSLRRASDYLRSLRRIIRPNDMVGIDFDLYTFDLKEEKQKAYKL